MKRYLKTDEWNIIEDNFHADNLRMSESIFSLGNGRFGQRGNFEEPYSSDSYRGSFVAGITFLDKTRVGWWKNGFPAFYTRIPNAADWSRVSLRLIDEELDLAQWDVNSFSRSWGGIPWISSTIGSIFTGFRISAERLSWVR